MPFLTEAQRKPISSSLRSNQKSKPIVPKKASTPPREPQSSNSPPEHYSGKIGVDDSLGSVLTPSADPQAAWENQIGRWLVSRGLVDDLGTSNGPLHTRLQDGVLLGRLLEGLEPGLRLIGFNPKARSRAAALANLELVLAAVWRRGPQAKDMPTAEEVISPLQLICLFHRASFKIRMSLSIFPSKKIKYNSHSLRIRSLLSLGLLAQVIHNLPRPSLPQ